MIYHGDVPVTEVVLHTAAIPDPYSFLKKYDTPQKQRDVIDQWHRNNGWSGIGYHAVCGYVMDGNKIKKVEIVPGRDKSKIGAHVKGHNTGTLGICMLNIKPHNGITVFEDYFPEVVKKEVKEWIKSLPGIEKVSGHNDYTNLKECPGFKVDSKEWLKNNEPWWKKFGWLFG